MQEMNLSVTEMKFSESAVILNFYGNLYLFSSDFQFCQKIPDSARNIKEVYLVTI